MQSKAAKYWLPIAISALALSISAYVVYVATQARTDTRAIAGLDLQPILRLHSVFKKIRNTPPHFVVTNVGPVEVVQLEIQPISYRTIRRDKKFRVATYGSEERRIVERLPPLATKSFPFSDHWLNVNARLGKPLEYNVMEIRLTYRRPPDMHQFVEGAFYFVNPQGHWVSENSSSLIPEIYDPIKEDVFRFTKLQLQTHPGDRLHPIERWEAVQPELTWWKDPITVATIVIAAAALFNFVVTIFLWRATKRNAKIARLVFEASERPYLGITSFEVADKREDKVLRISSHINNFGKVPALQMEAHWEEFSVGDMRGALVKKFPASEGTVVFPGVAITKSENIEGEAYDAMFEKAAKLQFSLLITYEGPRREKYWTKQTYLFEPKPPSFIALKGEVGENSPS